MYSSLSGLRVILLVLAVCVSCVAVHETGHVLAAVLTGGTVTDIVLFSTRPHVRVEGASTAADNAVKSVAGSGLLLVTWAGLMASVPRTRKSLLLIELAWLCVAAELLAWVLASSLYPSGPRFTDVTKFIRWSGLDPAAIAGCAFATGVAGWALYRRWTGSLEAVPARPSIK